MSPVSLLPSPSPTSAPEEDHLSSQIPIQRRIPTNRISIGSTSFSHKTPYLRSSPRRMIPLDYRLTVCDLFAQLAARGTTLLFSSGDSGVGGGNCRTNDGTNRVQFQPSFPASCPYVTAVGGTTGLTETTISFSGGGFSNTFLRPDFQNAAVTGYLRALGNTNVGLFNTTGRAYPDLSAQANRFPVIVGGRTISVGGTSASAPTVAGIVALLNDVRITNGKSSLGWLNPLIYSTGATGFNDITTGSNPGCGTNGFPARAGWDPATGLGTPDFLKLRVLLD
ncbi:hypothetical protein ONZ45_g16241 [Pleurotus djamor]|nr:hypothetical protein ONZ45_g16241 [Pleurotus djamor]